MSDPDVSEKIIDWYASVVRRFMLAIGIGLLILGGTWASRRLPVLEFIEKLDGGVAVAAAGLVWIISFIFLFLKDSLRESKSALRRQQKELDYLKKSMEHVSIEGRITRDHFRFLAEQMHDLQKAIAERPPTAPVAAARPDNGRCTDELLNRIAWMERKVEVALASTPPEPGPQGPPGLPGAPASIENAPLAPPVPTLDETAPFEVYRADLLKMWDGDMTIDEFVRAWSGRKHHPRPRPWPPASEVPE